MGLDVDVRVQTNVLSTSLAFIWSSNALGADDAAASLGRYWARCEAMFAASEGLDRTRGKEANVLDDFQH